MKQAKLQWFQNPSQINGDNLNKGTRKIMHSINFRNKKKEYLKEKLMSLQKPREQKYETRM